MTLTKKKFVLKNKKRKKNRKTYKKHKKTYKKLRKKRIGGVNINLANNDNSPQNIRIFARFTPELGGDLDITGGGEHPGMVEIFRESGFADDDDDDSPPTFLQLQNAFIKGITQMLNLNTEQTDNFQIKVFAYSPSKKPIKNPVYTTGDTNGDKFLEADTEYYIIPNLDKDKIAEAITDPSIGTAFGLSRGNQESQRYRADSTASRAVQTAVEEQIQFRNDISRFEEFLKRPDISESDRASARARLLYLRETHPGRPKTELSADSKASAEKKRESTPKKKPVKMPKYKQAMRQAMKQVKKK